MQVKGRPFAKPADINRAFSAAWSVLTIVGKLGQAVGYYLNDDLRPSSDTAMERLAADLRELRVAGHEICEELRKPYVSEAFSRAAVRMRLPAVEACELRAVNAHFLMAMIGQMAQLRIPKVFDDKIYLTCDHLDNAAEKLLRRDLLGSLEAWHEMGQDLDIEGLSVRLQQESAAALERAEEQESELQALLSKKEPKSESAANGPFGIDGFAWENVKARGLSPRAWKLIAAAWPAQDHTCSFDAGCSAVHGEDYNPEMIPDHPLDGSRKDANAFFAEHCIPLRVSISGNKRIGRVCIAEEKPIRSKKPKKSKMPARRR